MLQSVAWLVWLCIVPLSFAESASEARSPCAQVMVIDGTAICFRDYISKLNFFAEFSKEHPEYLCDPEWMCGGTNNCVVFENGVMKTVAKGKDLISCGGPHGGSKCGPLASLCSCTEGMLDACKPYCNESTEYKWKCFRNPGGCHTCVGGD